MSHIPLFFFHLPQTPPLHPRPEIGPNQLQGVSPSEAEGNYGSWRKPIVFCRRWVFRESENPVPGSTSHLSSLPQARQNGRRSLCLLLLSGRSRALKDPHNSGTRSDHGAWKSLWQVLAAWGLRVSLVFVLSLFPFPVTRADRLFPHWRGPFWIEVSLRRNII